MSNLGRLHVRAGRPAEGRPLVDAARSRFEAIGAAANRIVELLLADRNTSQARELLDACNARSGGQTNELPTSPGSLGCAPKPLRVQLNQARRLR